MQVYRNDKDTSAAALHVLAAKYDIPAVFKLARGALLCSLTSKVGEPLHTNLGHLDPWMLASRAIEMTDADLLNRCMSTLCGPLEKGGGIAPAPAYLQTWLGPVLNELVAEVNKAVVGIPAKLCSSAGKTHKARCSSLSDEVRGLKAKCSELESSQKLLKSQVEKYKKRCMLQKPK